MATVTQIKGVLSFVGDCFGLGPVNVGNGGIARLKAWFEADYAEALDGREATADDFGAWIYRQVRGKVLSYEERVRNAANPEPPVPEFEDTP